MEYTWTNDLSVGHRNIDRDHQHLFELANRFFASVREGQAEILIGETLQELVLYTNTHFFREEELMLSIAYPAFAEHKRAHDALLAVVQQKLQQWREGSVALSIELFGFLEHWLRHHIMTHDQQLAATIQGQNQALSGER